MRKYLLLATLVALVATAFSNCGTSSEEVLTGKGAVASASEPLRETPLSLDSLPAMGYVSLDPVNSVELDRLGLGGPSPLLDPPSSPFNRYGMYWSKPFSLVEGDTVEITVHSDLPISWFGVDWSSYAVRGILATTEVDEDGRAFNPQYPAHSSLDEGPNGYKLTLSYKIPDDTDCVLVVKNANPDNSRRLSVSVSLKPSLSLRRILKRLPIVKNLIASDNQPR
jgi:hypothetical protein